MLYPVKQGGIRAAIPKRGSLEGLMSKKLISVFVAAGLGFGLNTVIAQNVDSDKDKAQAQEQLMRDKEQSSGQSQTQAGTMRNFNDAGERQIGLEQYLQEAKLCSGAAAEARQDCMHLAKVRYEGWAIMQCQLISGVGQQRCYQNIQAAVLANRNPASAGTPSTNGSPETGAVKRSEDRQ